MPSSRRLAAAVVFSLLGLAPAFAQDKAFELKLSHWMPESHPLQKTLEEWGNAVERASGGTLTYKVYPAQQLGKGFDHYDMAKDGIADLAFINPGYQPGRFPIIGAGDLPLLVSDAKGGSQAIDGWYRRHAAGEMKEVKFCLAFLHDPGTFHSRTKKIAVPSDIKGLKIRPAQATIGAWITQLGGSNVQSSEPEARTILERGAAEAVTLPWGAIPLLGIDKVTKYHLDVPLYVTAFALVFNKARYDEMSAAQKKAIDDHCTNEWAIKFAEPWADFERAGAEKLKADPANEIYKLSDAQLAEWKKSAEPLEKAWAANVKRAGGDPDKILKEFKGTLGEYKAAF